MIIDPIVTKVNPVTGESYKAVCDSAVHEIWSKGCAVPDITHVTYNLGKKKNAEGKEYPVLTTVLDFADGSKEVVQNSEDDGLQLDNEGRSTVFAKEAGIAFCLMKRLTAGKYVCNDGNLAYKSAGFGRILSELVKNSVDQNELNKMRKEKKSKNKMPKPEKTISVKSGNVSLAKTVNNLSDTITDFKNFVCSIKNDLLNK